jgi:hypothetical protein
MQAAGFFDRFRANAKRAVSRCPKALMNAP